MDYTRLTQNGRWSGHFSVDGVKTDVGADCFGTRDRSWGIRPVGKPDSQPAPQAMDGAMPQFFWLWTPSNFADRSLFLHTNDDGEGAPWNRRGVLFADGGAAVDYDAPEISYEWEVRSRRVTKAVVQLDAETRVTLTPTGSGMGSRGHFYMNGLGYTHPEWGHGMDHGTSEVGYDRIDLNQVNDNDFANLHIQAVADVTIEQGGSVIQGRGLVEQFFLGEHAPTGLKGLYDPRG